MSSLFQQRIAIDTVRGNRDLTVWAYIEYLLLAITLVVYILKQTNELDRAHRLELSKGIHARLCIMFWLLVAVMVELDTHSTPALLWLKA
jgi:hypothetical protein